MDINIRIAGEAGQGVASVGTIILEALCDVGYNIFSTQSYMSRIRGGLNWSDIRVADFELFGPRPTADILVALSPEALDVLASKMASGGIILSEGESSGEILGIPFSKIAKDKTGNALMANAVAAGAVFGVLGGSIDGLCDFLRRHFNKKEAEVIEKNIVCAKEGFALTSRQNFAKLKLGTPPPSTPKYLGNGAAAIGLGAASSGLKFVTAYPMTPGTATFTWLAGAADQYGIVVEQAEDEIAAMNMICGAAYAGVPAMTCTSGGGFALMCEGLSLAGMMELPVLVMLAQRPGPATGLPTRTGQEDLKFALNAGHGEFPRAIFAPGSIEECFELSRRALETAHKHQTPVILLTDQFLQDIQKNIAPFPSDYQPIDRNIVASTKDYKRYALSPNGVSPRSIPGLGEGLVVCDSDEHDECGHLTEDLEMRVMQQRKRMSKIESLLEESLPPSRYGNSKAEILLVCWGSTFGPCREAVDLLNAKRDNSAAILHFSQVWPLAPEKIAPLLSGAKKIVSVEGNYTGQFRSLLREAGLVGQDCGLIGRYDGLPFNGEFIVREFEL